MFLRVWHERRSEQIREWAEPMVESYGLVVKTGVGDDDLALLFQADHELDK